MIARTFWRNSGQRGLLSLEKPDLFIVGAPKCGTTALSNFLGEHPDIYMARKEMHVFGTDLRFGPQFYRRDLEAYLAEFSARNGRRHSGEASVWYLFSAHAAAEIKAFNPNARIVIMLREPSEMLYSLYYQFRSDGNEHLPTLEEALAAEDDRRAGRRISRRAYFPQGLSYREAARYTLQVRRYFEAFGRERVHVVLYDDFAADTAKTYRTTLEFLEVDSTRMATDFKVINGNKALRPSALRTLLRDPFLCRLVLTVRPWLPRPVFATLQKVDARLRNTQSHPAPRPPLAPELRARLNREFAPEVERLSELLGRDLTAWSKNN